MKEEAKLFAESVSTFLENYPLLTWKEITFPQTDEDFDFNFQLELFCETCGKSRPFKNAAYKNVGGGAGLGQSLTAKEKPTSGLRYFTFFCTSCGNQYKYTIYFDTEKSRIRKIGQYPPWEIDIDNEIEKFLKENKEYYKKALICESQGYGIAAYAYYRRVLENMTNDIINEIIEVEKLTRQGKNIDILNKAFTRNNTEEKLRIVKEILPDYLCPGGINPFREMYKILSEGIHKKTEEECNEYARSIRTCFVFVIKTLNNTKKEVEAFSYSLNKIRK